MIIGTFEKLKIGEIVVPSGDMALFDKGFKAHMNPFLVLKEATHEEYIQGLIDSGVTPNWAEKARLSNINYYEISID